VVSDRHFLPQIVSRFVVAKKFQIDALDDHVRTCTVHFGDEKAHDWSVEQLADLFHTTHRASHDINLDLLI
jgi:hypothetical protein